jgi:hypothetical protein
LISDLCNPCRIKHQESDPDSKGAQKESAKKAEKAAKKAAQKAPDGVVGTPAVTETTPAPDAVTISSQTKIDPSLTPQTTDKKTNPSTALSIAPSKKKKSAHQQQKEEELV